MGLADHPGEDIQMGRMYFVVQLIHRTRQVHHCMLPPVKVATGPQLELSSMFEHEYTIAAETVRSE